MNTEPAAHAEMKSRRKQRIASPYALVRRCDVCGIVNAVDLNGNLENEMSLQMEDHVVKRMSREDALQEWKHAGRCNHKALIADLRQQLNAFVAHVEPF
jgi:hypothetical protein